MSKVSTRLSIQWRVDRVFLFNSIVIDCGFGQQIRLRVKKNCCCQRNQSISVCYTPSFFQNCPKPQADGNRSVRGSNETAVVKETSLQSITVLLFTFIFSLKNYSFFPLTYLGTYVRRVRESKRYCDVNMTSLSHDLLNQ